MRKFFFMLVVAAIAAPLGAQLVTPRNGAPQILIPAAGSVAGANGTFFRSDITLINYRTDADQRVQIYWLPQGVSGIGSNPKEMTLPAGTGTVSEDFVTTVLGKSGLGAILITAVTESGTVDANGKLFATSRIWTPQPGSTGTVSQTFPAISTTDLTLSRQTIIGQRRDDRYRVNVGIVNLDTVSSQLFQISAKSGGTELQNVTVPPFSMVQVPLTGVATPILQISVSNITSTARTPFATYGSSVDNVTGDSWSSLGFVIPADANQ